MSAVPTNPTRLCFVMMPFTAELHYFYLYVKSHIERVHHFACERADDRVITGPILDKIIDYIRRSDIIIADCSGRNANVFYELGIAHALDKKVILITKDPIQEAPSDIRHLEFIKEEMGGHINFLDRLDNAFRIILFEYYENPFMRARRIFDEFRVSTMCAVSPVTSQESIRRVVEAEVTTPLPSDDDDFSVTEFVLPKIIDNNMDVSIMSLITGYVLEVGERSRSKDLSEST